MRSLLPIIYEALEVEPSFERCYEPNLEKAIGDELCSVTCIWRRLAFWLVGRVSRLIRRRTLLAWLSRFSWLLPTLGRNSAD